MESIVMRYPWVTKDEAMQAPPKLEEFADNKFCYSNVGVCLKKDRKQCEKSKIAFSSFPTV